MTWPGPYIRVPCPAQADPLGDLVYRVHPLPLTMSAFLFDFGALSPSQEVLCAVAAALCMCSGRHP